ncbi:M15 family metallopeptidase [Nocardioides aequoreus]|uniref:M15 family metallopeptidase n=1 Tax=Nocardioides aequoreus TaxID=397278 RepID=UPI000A05A5F5|nr:M15 family metallopeptidase [Nocardioides aequoreus]
MRVSWVTTPLAVALLLAGCGRTPNAAPVETPASSPDASVETTPSVAPSSPVESSPPVEPSSPVEPVETPTPPPWLGTRELPLAANGFGEARRTPPALRERAFTLPDTVEPLPGDGFASDVVAPAPQRVVARSTWQPACPVGRDRLAWVRAAFRGFDGRRHTGELLLDRGVAADVVQVFDRLWRADFPLEELRITRRDELDAPPTGDGNNSGGFVCRPVVGGTTYSQHAYGLAVDLNPFQNPYTKGDVVLPELASSYLDRDRRRPGMYDADSVVVRAFAEIGWTWGGTWRTAQDRHHFSLTGG